MKSVILVLDPKIIFQNFTPNNCNNETNFSIFDISVLNVLKLTLKSLEAKQFTFQKTLCYCHWKQFHSVKMCENLQNPNDKIIILEVLILSLTIIIIALACDSVISSKFCLKPTNRGGQLHLIYISGDILTARHSTLHHWRSSSSQKIQSKKVMSQYNGRQSNVPSQINC